MRPARTTPRIALYAMSFIDRSIRCSGGDGKKKKGKSVVPVLLSVGPRAVSGGKRENKKERGLSLATRLPIDLPRWRCTGKEENKRRRLPIPHHLSVEAPGGDAWNWKKKNQKTEPPCHLPPDGNLSQVGGYGYFFFRIHSLHLVGINESVYETAGFLFFFIFPCTTLPVPCVTRWQSI